MQGLHGLGQAYGGGRLGNVASVKLHAVTRDLTDGGSSTSALRTVRPKFSSSRAAATIQFHTRLLLPSSVIVYRFQRSTIKSTSRHVASLRAGLTLMIYWAGRRGECRQCQITVSGI